MTDNKKCLNFILWFGLTANRRAMAFERMHKLNLTTTELLVKVIHKHKDKLVRVMAVDYLDDMELIYCFARYNKDKNVRIKAIEKTDNEELLLIIYDKDPDPNIRFFAVAGIHNSAELEKRFQWETSDIVRLQMLEMIQDDEFMKKTAMWGKKCIKMEAVNRITSTDGLQWVRDNSKNAEVRAEAERLLMQRKGNKVSR